MNTVIDFIRQNIAGIVAVTFLLVIIVLFIKYYDPVSMVEYKLVPFVFFNQIKIGGFNMLSVKDNVTSVKGHWGTPVSAKGNPSTVQAGSVAMESSDPTVATVEKDPDGTGDELSFRVNFTGKTGPFTITAKADADLTDDQNPDTTEDEKIITGSFNGEVTPGQAVGFGEPTFDTPVEG